MPNELVPNETQWLDEAFPDSRKRETVKPNEASVEALRQSFQATAKVVLQHCPTSADRSAALRTLRDGFNTAVDALTKKLPRV